MITYRDLAQLVSSPTPFNRDSWIFELKHEGFRMCAAHRKGRVELVSCRGNDFADRFPESLPLLQLPRIVLDSELVILNADGRADFERLATRWRLTRATSIERSARSSPAWLYTFDLLELEGKDFRSLPLTVRKAMLKEVVATFGEFAIT